MSFKFQAHVRLAGVVMYFLGVLLNNNILFALGVLTVMVGYMWSIAKLEMAVTDLVNKDDKEEPRN